MRKLIFYSITVLLFTASNSFAQRALKKITLDGTIDLLVSQSGNVLTFSSKPKGTDADANMFEISEENGHLKIETSVVDGLKTYSCNMDALQTLEIDGATSLSTTNTLRFSNLTIWSDGVIDGPFNIDCPNLKVISNGAADFVIQGNGDNFIVEVNSVGSVCAKNFLTNITTVTTKGAGNAWVNARNTLIANANGVSDIFYKVYKASSVPEQRQPRITASKKGLGAIKTWNDSNASCGKGNGTNPPDEGNTNTTKFPPKKQNEPSKETPVEIKVNIPEIKIPQIKKTKPVKRPVKTAPVIKGQPPLN